MDPAIDFRGVLQVSIAKDLTKDSAKKIGVVGVGHANEEPLVWLVSYDEMSRMQNEKRNLIKAKVRAIIGTAVFGAGLAISIGTIIGLSSKKRY